MINRLEINNWKKYKRFDINFKEGINFIIGPNGIGKTSIIEAIIFGLTGRLKRVIEKERIRVVSEGNAQIDLQFEHDGKKYNLKRKNIHENSNFKLVFESELTNGEVLLKTNEEISSFILDLYKTNQYFFENIIYSTEGEIYSFISREAPRNFIKYLENIIGIGRIREFQNSINESYKLSEKRIKENE
ncbi:MAG: AAA family ATPase, partial [Candidatus Hodarchaeota archaeon]